MTRLPALTRLEEVLLGYLSRHCRGGGRARKQWKIAEDLTMLGLPDATPRTVRDTLASLRLKGVPVGTTSGDPPGAFLCDTRADFRKAYRNLYVRVRVQAKGCRRLKQTFREVFSGQYPLDFTEAEDAYRRLAEVPLLALVETGRPADAGRGGGP